MSRPSQIRFKRGDTFQFSAAVTDTAGTAIDITGWTIQAQVRNESMVLIDEAVITVTDAPGGEYQLTVADTTAWVPRETYVMDIQYIDSGGVKVSTETLYVLVLEDVTQ